MKEYKKFELGNTVDNRTYITGLKEIYDSHGYPTGGLVGLLSNSEFPGYCQLYLSWKSIQDENGNITMKFYPAYTKDKDYILIKTQKESTSVIFAHDPDSFKLVNGRTESIKDGFLKW